MSDKIISYTCFDCESSVRPELRIEKSKATLSIDGFEKIKINCATVVDLKDILKIYVDIFKDAENDL